MRRVRKGVDNPSSSPSLSPSFVPTTVTPTQNPSYHPSVMSTHVPTQAPTLHTNTSFLTQVPTRAPTEDPSSTPTTYETPTPTTPPVPSENPTPYFSLIKVPSEAPTTATMTTPEPTGEIVVTLPIVAIGFVVLGHRHHRNVAVVAAATSTTMTDESTRIRQVMEQYIHDLLMGDDEDNVGPPATIELSSAISLVEQTGIINSVDEGHPQQQQGLVLVTGTWAGTPRKPPPTPDSMIVPLSFWGHRDIQALLQEDIGLEVDLVTIQVNSQLVPPAGRTSTNADDSNNGQHGNNEDGNNMDRLRTVGLVIAVLFALLSILFVLNATVLLVRRRMCRTANKRSSREEPLSSSLCYGPAPSLCSKHSEKGGEHFVATESILGGEEDIDNDPRLNHRNMLDQTGSTTLDESPLTFKKTTNNVLFYHNPLLRNFSLPQEVPVPYYHDQYQDDQEEGTFFYAADRSWSISSVEMSLLTDSHMDRCDSKSLSSASPEKQKKNFLTRNASSSTSSRSSHQQRRRSRRSQSPQQHRAGSKSNRGRARDRGPEQSSYRKPEQSSSYHEHMLPHVHPRDTSPAGVFSRGAVSPSQQRRNQRNQHPGHKEQRQSTTMNNNNCNYPRQSQQHYGGGLRNSGNGSGESRSNSTISFLYSPRRRGWDRCGDNVTIIENGDMTAMT